MHRTNKGQHKGKFLNERGKVDKEEFLKWRNNGSGAADRRLRQLEKRQRKENSNSSP